VIFWLIFAFDWVVVCACAAADSHHETTFCSEIEALLMSGRSNLSNLSGRARMLRMRDCSGRSGIARSDKSHCDKPVKKFRQVRCRIATCLVTSSLSSLLPRHPASPLRLPPAVPPGKCADAGVGVEANMPLACHHCRLVLTAPSVSSSQKAFNPTRPRRRHRFIPPTFHLG